MDLTNVHELKQLETDDRGRAYLGPEYYDCEVRIAILESEPKANTNEDNE